MADAIYGIASDQNNANGVTAPLRAGRTGELIISSLHPNLYETAARGHLFYSLSTAQTLSAAGTAITGNILWNGSATMNLHLVKAQLIVSVTSASLTGIGLAATTPGAQITAPTTTTAATKTGSTFLGQAGSAATAYTIATTLATTTSFSLLHNTAAINTVGLDSFAADLAGIIVPPYTAVHLSALGAASAASAVTSTLWWEEVPV